MKVLVACEFSGIVRDAFRARGHDAFSVDIIPCEKGPDFHYERRIEDILEQGFKWDLMIAHPPCTYLTVAANKWMKPEYADRFPFRMSHRIEAIKFFMRLVNADIKRICIENPVGIISTAYRKPDQIIQPYQFGHPDRKKTCFWLKGLPPLKSTKIVAPNIKKNRNGKTASVHHDAALRLPANQRWKARSRTYQGIANAMAEQWGGPDEQ